MSTLSSTLSLSLSLSRPLPLLLFSFSLFLPTLTTLLSQSFANLTIPPLQLLSRVLNPIVVLDRSRYRSPPPHLDSAGRSRSVPFFAHPTCLNASLGSSSRVRAPKLSGYGGGFLISVPCLSSKHLTPSLTPPPTTRSPPSLPEISPAAFPRQFALYSFADRNPVDLQVYKSILQLCDGRVGRWRVA